MDDIDATTRLEILHQQINLVKHEHERLTQGEYALLMMLEQTVLVIEALSTRCTVDMQTAKEPQ